MWWAIRLYAKCIPCFTDCTIAELEKLGPKYRLALRVAKDPRWTRLQCSHSGTYADDCIVDRVSTWIYMCTLAISMLTCIDHQTSNLHRGHERSGTGPPHPQDPWCADYEGRKREIHHWEIARFLWLRARAITDISSMSTRYEAIIPGPGEGPPIGSSKPSTPRCGIGQSCSSRTRFSMAQVYSSLASWSFMPKQYTLPISARLRLVLWYPLLNELWIYQSDFICLLQI